MADILIANAPAEVRIMQGYYESFENLGILYIKASLQQSGYTVELLDSLQDKSSLDDMLVKISCSLPALYIGFSVGVINIRNSLCAIQKLRRSGVQVHTEPANSVAP